jgi:hypothetical protein
MSDRINIMHIDPDYKVTYFIFRHGGSIRSTISLEQAISLLKAEKFDLIISEPHNRAILKSENSSAPKDICVLH